jgi:hypothetical protein
MGVSMRGFSMLVCVCERRPGGGAGESASVCSTGTKQTQGPEITARGAFSLLFSLSLSLSVTLSVLFLTLRFRVYGLRCRVRVKELRQRKKNVLLRTTQMLSAPPYYNFMV